jgi:DNA-directed RNA polymerase subunit RPC12/RpoP
MDCPKCRSDLLMIRQKTGLERVRSFMTGTREYRCRDCDQKFRAPDRRSVPREEKLPASVKTRIG